MVEVLRGGTAVLARAEVTSEERPTRERSVRAVGHASIVNRAEWNTIPLLRMTSAFSLSTMTTARLAATTASGDSDAFSTRARPIRAV